MEYLHNMSIVHRDVKPENILYCVEGGTDIKLIDFGYAGIWSPDKQLTGLCGTPDYVAPEVLSWYEDDESGTPYGAGSDMWSMGVLLYVILSGCSPFNGDCSSNSRPAFLLSQVISGFSQHAFIWAFKASRIFSSSTNRLPAPAIASST